MEMTSYCEFFGIGSYLYLVVTFPQSLPKCFKITTFLKTKAVAWQMFHLTQVIGVQFLVCQARVSLKLCLQSWVCSALLCLWNVLPNAPQIQLLYPENWNFPLTDLKSKMQTHGYSYMRWFFSDEYRSTYAWTKSVLPIFLMHMHFWGEGKTTWEYF